MKSGKQSADAIIDTSLASKTYISVSRVQARRLSQAMGHDWMQLVQQAHLVDPLVRVEVQAQRGGPHVEVPATRRLRAAASPSRGRVVAVQVEFEKQRLESSFSLWVKGQAQGWRPGAFKLRVNWVQLVQPRPCPARRARRTRACTTAWGRGPSASSARGSSATRSRWGWRSWRRTGERPSRSGGSYCSSSSEWWGLCRFRHPLAVTRPGSPPPLPQCATIPWTLSDEEATRGLQPRGRGAEEAGQRRKRKRRKEEEGTWTCSAAVLFLPAGRQESYSLRTRALAAAA
jgi:hypothetical protein